jgi:nicotinamidase-related amidase
MLNDFIHPQGALYCGKEGEAIVPFIKNRLKSAREANRLVIYMTDSHDEDDVEFDRYPPHAVTGKWGSEIIADLAPRPGETVVAKKTLNSFLGTDLERILADAGVESVEVVGVCTSICVMDLVGDLAARNYRILVPKKGVADFDQEFHQFALKRMAGVYGAKVS